VYSPPRASLDILYLIIVLLDGRRSFC